MIQSFLVNWCCTIPCARRSRKHNVCWKCLSNRYFEKAIWKRNHFVAKGCKGWLKLQSQGRKAWVCEQKCNYILPRDQGRIGSVFDNSVCNMHQQRFVFVWDKEGSWTKGNDNAKNCPCFGLVGIHMNAGPTCCIVVPLAKVMLENSLQGNSSFLGLLYLACNPCTCRKSSSSILGSSSKDAATAAAAAAANRWLGT